MPPIIDSTKPDTEMASPPHNTGSILPAADPTKKPIHMNLLVTFSVLVRKPFERFELRLQEHHRKFGWFGMRCSTSLLFSVQVYVIIRSPALPRVNARVIDQGEEKNTGSS